MPNQTILLVVMDATDLTRILGMARVESLPDFLPNEVVHSSNPDLPLHNKSPALFRVNLYSSRRRVNAAIIEVVNATHFGRDEMPVMWSRGHKVALTFTGRTQLENYQIPSFWEVTVDDKTVGAIADGPIDKVAGEALAMANSYIDEAITTRKSAF
jgi:hypothetical protein